MKLKEVLNLRKLKEEFYDVESLGCEECPFSEVCNEKDNINGCIVSRIYDEEDRKNNKFELDENIW